MNAETEADSVDLDKLVAVYVKLRDKKSELQKEFSEKEAEVDAKMDTIKAALLDHCSASGAESVRTASGTFYRSVKRKYWTSDWTSMNRFIVDNNALDLLEKRLHQTNMRAFLEENPDKLPPGLNVESEYTITVRRK
jgi:hypothetical protein